MLTILNHFLHLAFFIAVNNFLANEGMIESVYNNIIIRGNVYSYNLNCSYFGTGKIWSAVCMS